MTTSLRAGLGLTLAALLLLAPAPSSQAAGIPVEDLNAVGRLIAQLTPDGFTVRPPKRGADPSPAPGAISH